MQNTEIKPEADLKQFHKVTDRHVLVLEADISEYDKRELLHMSNIIRVADNELIAVMKKQYEQLLRTKRYRHLQDMYVKAKKAEDKKQVNVITAEMTEMQKPYLFPFILHTNIPLFISAASRLLISSHITISAISSGKPYQHIAIQKIRRLRRNLSYIWKRFMIKSYT